MANVDSEPFGAAVEAPDVTDAIRWSLDLQKLVTVVPDEYRQFATEVVQGVTNLVKQYESDALRRRTETSHEVARQIARLERSLTDTKAWAKRLNIPMRSTE